MHGMWLLMILPVGGLLAWKGSLSNSIWFWRGVSWLAFVGALGVMCVSAAIHFFKPSPAIDCLYYGFGTLVASFNVPIVQVMIAGLIGLTVVSRRLRAGLRSKAA